MTTQTVDGRARRSAPLLTSADTRTTAADARSPFPGPDFANDAASPVAGTAFGAAHPGRTLRLDVAGPARLVATGVDLTDVGRIAAALQRTGPALVRRVCGPGERAVLDQLGPAMLPWALALAFGLTEAVVKAAGGIPPGGLLTDVDASAVLDRLGDPAAEGSTVEAAVVVGGATGQVLHALAPDVTVSGGARRIGPQLLVCWVLATGDIR